MNVSKEIGRIKNADKNIKLVLSQGKIVFTKKILSTTCTVNFKISIPKDIGTIRIISTAFKNKTYATPANFSCEIGMGNIIRVTYIKRDRAYKFFSNIPDIEKGITIEKDCDIWVGFNKLDEEIM